ncbi:uncharacterized protein LOC126837793 [Adelges cooleyi]|uniref:uncharacterized protein LOC126837793 n=1 Tax=Adelges cooleyi TaxID=133065 RepID=UPI00217FB979|nr:uncharacterized protein LOC126837793 [Adelges cooleyi]
MFVYTQRPITRLQPAGWKHINDSNTSRGLMDKTEFVAQYPLSACMGFFERFRRVLINCTQTLVLIRSSRDIGTIELIQPAESDKKDVIATANVSLLKQTSVKITKIKWIVKYFEPNVKTELGLMRILDGKRWLPLEYQHWDIAVYPMVPQTTHHTWSVRTFSNVEKPRYLLIALGKEHSIMSKSDFQHCTLRNVKAYLNSDEYPYENYNTDFDAGKYTSMYNAYVRFQSMYYGRTNPQALLDRVHYKELGPIVVINCSKQNDTAKTSTVDLRLDFECANSFPQNISLYCVIIHDCQMEYNGFSGEVRKL